MATTRIERLRALVHRLDDLETQRAALDAQISEVSAELDALAGGPAPKAARPPPAAARAARAGPDASGAPRSRGAHADLALELVSKNPRIGYGDLAQQLYGTTDEAARGRARSVIHFLVTRAKKLRRAPDGALEVISPAQPAETGT